MRFQIEKNNDSWSISPVDHNLAGVRIASVDIVEMTNVTHNFLTFRGEISAPFGLVIHDEKVHDDMELLRAFKINKTFRYRAQRPAHVGSGILLDVRTQTEIPARFRHLLLTGDSIYWGD